MKTSDVIIIGLAGAAIFYGVSQAFTSPSATATSSDNSGGTSIAGYAGAGLFVVILGIALASPIGL